MFVPLQLQVYVPGRPAGAWQELRRKADAADWWSVLLLRVFAGRTVTRRARRRKLAHGGACTGARQCVDEEDAPGGRRRGLAHRAHLGPRRTGFPALIALNLRLKIGLFCHFFCLPLWLGSRQEASTGGLGPQICVVESDLVLSHTMAYALATRRRSP
jgi:hypothetical protein